MPIIVASEDGVVDLFRDAEHLATYAEAIDVRNGEYARAFDASGRRVELAVTPDDRVVVREAEAIPSHGAELRAALIASLRLLPSPPSLNLDAASLDQLIEASRVFMAP